MIKICYIAGRFRGPTTWDIAQNVRAAEAAGLDVARLGAMPLIPHANTALFQNQGSDAFWLEGTLELLRRCDAIYVFNPKHLETSVGTKAEWALAEKEQIPRFQDLGALEAWLKTSVRPREFRLGDTVVYLPKNLIAFVDGLHDSWNGFDTTKLLTLRPFGGADPIEVPARDVIWPEGLPPCKRANGIFGCVLGLDHPGNCAPANFSDV